MDKHIVPAFTLDEAEAFGSVEPFNRSFFFHKPSPEKDLSRWQKPGGRKCLCVFNVTNCLTA
jgi:hypothetical protein